MSKIKIKKQKKLKWRILKIKIKIWKLSTPYFTSSTGLFYNK